MTGFALRSLLARRRRAGICALAVFLGVSMIAGTFVFTDTINAAYRQLFSGTFKAADVIVSSRQEVSAPAGAPEPIPVSLVLQIRGLPGVAAAQGQVSDLATIIGRDGKPVTGNAGPTLALSYLPPPFTGSQFVGGVRPTNSSEVAIDDGTARRERYRVGDEIGIVTGQPLRKFRISGIVRISGASASAAPLAVFDLGTARGLYGKENLVDQIYVAAAAGVRPSTLVREIRPLLSPELIARTTSGQVQADVSRVGDQLSILTGGLLAFGLIAVFVGAFVIFNTFSITVAQRTHELALLRVLGATRGQVLAGVLLEAVAIGATASLAGLLGGLGAAALIHALFSAVGLHLPSAGLRLEARTALLAVGAGVAVTVAAGLIPALRTARIAPLAALRDSLAPPVRRRWARGLGLAPAAAFAGAGLVLVFTSSGSSNARLTQAAIGAVLLVLAVVALTPRTIRRLSGVLSWPLRRHERVLGELARENAARHPARTAVTASSLMIGLALVLFVTIYASGVRAATGRIISRTLGADFTVGAEDGSSSIPASTVRVVTLLPNVASLSSTKNARATLGRSGTITATGFDPNTIAQVYRFDWVNGSDVLLAGLDVSDVLVERDTAIAAHLRVGEQTLLVTATGRRTTVTVRGIYVDRALFGGVALPLTTFNSVFHQARLQDVFIKLAPGADQAGAAASLRAALKNFPGVVARSDRQLRDNVAARVNSILTLFYALLAMSIVMALLGMVNTLTLSIHERTRELGMLRAIGMTPEQARTLIRQESMVTAAIGTAVGASVGLGLAWVVTSALPTEDFTFTVPWLQLALVIAVGLLAGALAGLVPARRAARLDVLAAIAQE